MSQRGNRRELLAEAAIEVLAQEGGRGLTHRAIDREAAVPEGTAKNYYPTRSALLIAVARHLAEQHTSALRQLVSQAPSGLTSADVTRLYASMLRRSAGNARSQYLALFELHLEAVRNPDVRSALAEIARANADAAVELNAAVGHRMSRHGAGLLDAGMLGVALSVLTLPEDVADELGLSDAEGVAQALLAVGSTDGGPVVGVLRDCAS